ncbi:MAG: hypothetical protein GYB65_00090, partial [Chloroflexi bacterium]|nr:hypothetical protein [Chloroflexota bacterium]
RYHLYGLTLASDFVFSVRLESATGQPDLTFQRVDEPPSRADLSSHTPVYISPHRTKTGSSVASLYRLPDYHVLRFHGFAEYYVGADTVFGHVLDPRYHYMLEIFFLGNAMSLWLEMHQTLALHASAVEVNGGTIAFLADSRGGKTSLAAQFVQQGFPLVTDDILAIGSPPGFLGQRGYPQMRLWPDVAQHFLGRYQELELVHPDYTKRRVRIGTDFGQFAVSATPLQCIYIPERYETTDEHPPITITVVSPAIAIMELLRHSFVARMVDALNMQQQRMQALSVLIRSVPVCTVRFPSGFDHLPRVQTAILEDYLKHRSASRA